MKKPRHMPTKKPTGNAMAEMMRGMDKSKKKMPHKGGKPKK